MSLGMGLLVIDSINSNYSHYLLRNQSHSDRPTLCQTPNVSHSHHSRSTGKFSYSKQLYQTNHHCPSIFILLSTSKYLYFHNISWVTRLLYSRISPNSHRSWILTTNTVLYQTGLPISSCHMRRLSPIS